MRARLRRDGVMYSVNSAHAGNSQIYFYPNGDLAASIKHIFDAGDGTRLAIHRAQTLPEYMSHPFSRYPHFPAKLYGPYITTNLEIVDPAWIYCHYARWAMDANHVIILKLIRVSSLFLILEFLLSSL